MWHVECASTRTQGFASKPAGNKWHSCGVVTGGSAGVKEGSSATCSASCATGMSALLLPAQGASCSCGGDESAVLGFLGSHMAGHTLQKKSGSSAPAARGLRMEEGCVDLLGRTGSRWGAWNLRDVSATLPSSWQQCSAGGTQTGTGHVGN